MDCLHPCHRPVRFLMQSEACAGVPFPLCLMYPFDNSAAPMLAKFKVLLFHVLRVLLPTIFQASKALLLSLDHGPVCCNGVCRRLHVLPL